MNNEEQKQKRKQTVETVLRIAASVLLLLLLYAAGAFCAPLLAEAAVTAVGFSVLGIMVLLIVLLIGNRIAASAYNKSLNKSVKETQEIYLARKEAAAQNLPKAVRKIVTLRRLYSVYSAALLLLGMYHCFALGLAQRELHLIWVPLFLFYSVFEQIPFSRVKFDFSQYADPKDYPALHALAKKAATALGKTGEIRIRFLPDCNAGIAKLGKTFSLQLGTMLLDVLTEEELYQVLLHEFAHLTKDGNPTDREFRLFSRITEEKTNPLRGVSNWLYAFPQVLYVFEFLMYRMTCSVSIESLADHAVLTHGDAQTAANALAKIAMSSLYEAEPLECPAHHFYAPETLRTDIAEENCRRFRAALAERKDFWGGLLAKEIQSRSASHPIFRARMESLGVTSYTFTIPNGEGACRAEIERAKAAVSKEIYDVNCEFYAKDREEHYLKLKKTVDLWKESGKDPAAEESRELIDALRFLGMREELDALCDRLIASTDNVFATARAQMAKGDLLLSRYDPSGIAYIYRAIELNQNYAEPGLEKIGSFCCTMGLQEELDEYRARAVELAQFENDVYDQVGVLNAKDNLVRDDLSKEMLEDILRFVRSLGDHGIEKLFLVKKLIDDTHSTSAFVVKFKESASEETVDRVMDALFDHLDTRPEDHQFSLFSYNPQTASAVASVPDSCVFEGE